LFPVKLLADTSLSLFLVVNQISQENGHCNVPHMYEENKSLGIWVGRQRRAYNNGTHTEERKRMLDSIGFDPNPIKSRWDDMGWDDMFKRLIKYKEVSMMISYSLWT
ncbi:MAG: helicase associated domain-containing protein, partial [Schleiferiaceae bacterium]